MPNPKQAAATHDCIVEGGSKSKHYGRVGTSRLDIHTIHERPAVDVERGVVINTDED